MNSVTKSIAHRWNREIDRVRENLIHERDEEVKRIQTESNALLERLKAQMAESGEGALTAGKDKNTRLREQG